MTRFAVATEDALSEAVAEVLLRQAGDHDVGMRLRRAGFGYLKSRTRSFDDLARNVMPVLLVTDLDRAACPLELIAGWFPRRPNDRFYFRVAVRETEAWLLADREAFADLLGLSVSLVPRRPDELDNPKTILLELVRRSKRRELKADVLPARGVAFPVGLGYNDRLGRFVRESWDSSRAAECSPSLARAVARLGQFESVGQ